MNALRFLLVATLLPFAAQYARAEEAQTAAKNEAPAAEPAAAPTRSVWLAPTYQVLLSDAFEPSSRHGIGALAGYEFHVAPTFNVGFVLAYRFFPGSTATSQLGYGAILKHFFSDAWASESGVYPYLDYGLLLQQSFIEGRRGSAVSHDTRLGGGALMRFNGTALFASLAGHYSRLQYFDIDSKWIPFMELQFGWAHPF
jgi:hypothetical protein